MGKGDRRTRRGKIYAGSFGKSRPKTPPGAKGAKGGKPGKPPVVKTAPVAKPAAKPAPRKKSS